MSLAGNVFQVNSLESERGDNFHKSLKVLQRARRITSLKCCFEEPNGENYMDKIASFFFVLNYFYGTETSEN